MSCHWPKVILGVSGRELRSYKNPEQEKFCCAHCHSWKKEHKTHVFPNWRELPV